MIVLYRFAVPYSEKPSTTQIPFIEMEEKRTNGERLILNTIKFAIISNAPIH